MTLCLTTTLFCLANCASQTELERHEYYTRHYGSFLEPSDDDTKLADQYRLTDKSGFGAELTKTLEITPLSVEIIEEDFSADDASPLSVIEAHIRKYAVLTDDPTIERLFTTCEAYFEVRDYPSFQQACDLYLNSFPNSAYVPRILEMFGQFFVKENIENRFLTDGMVEIEFPFFRNRREMLNYFEGLRRIGAKEVVFSPFQQGIEKKVLFADFKSNTGAYFESDTIPVVDDILGDMVEAAKKAGLQFLVKFPLREYPWLKYYDSLLMGQVRIQPGNREEYHPKLNLMHIVTPTYLKKILAEILRYDIDGILLNDDYTYSVSEGYSSFNQIRYEDEKKLKFNPKLSFNDKWLYLKKQDYKVLFRNKNNPHRKYSEWRMTTVHKLMLELIAFIRSSKSTVKTGVIVFPDIMNNDQMGLFWYSMQGSHLSRLPVDFFVLHWKHRDDIQNASPQEYKQAAIYLNQFKSDRQEIYLQAPLENRGKGMFVFREKVDKMNTLLFELGQTKLAVGNINRKNNADLIFP